MHPSVRGQRARGQQVGDAVGVLDRRGHRGRARPGRPGSRRQAGRDLQARGPAGNGHAGRRPRSGEAPPELRGRLGGQVAAQQHRGRRGPGVDGEQLAPRARGARGHRHRGADSGRPGDHAGGGERQRRREGSAQVRAGRERRLVGGGAAGRLVLGQGQGQRGGGQDHQQERPALPDRAAGDLPAGQRDGEPPAPGRAPLGQPGHGREQAQHEHGHGGQRERGRDGDHRVDAEPAGGRVRDRRIGPQLPHGQHRHGQQRQVGSGARDPGQRGLPAPANPGRTRGNRAHRGPEHDRGGEHEHGGRGPPRRYRDPGKPDPRAGLGDPDQ